MSNSSNSQRGGESSFRGLDYQKKFIAYLCTEMLLGKRKIKRISCEHLDDIEVEEDSKLVYYQIKSTSKDSLPSSEIINSIKLFSSTNNSATAKSPYHEYVLVSNARIRKFSNSMIRHPFNQLDDEIKNKILEKIRTRSEFLQNTFIHSFQQMLPLSLVDIEKRARLLNEINTPLVKAKNGQDKMLIDLEANEKDRRLDEIVQLSIPYLTEQMDDVLRKNILLRLWTGCMEAAKAIRFTSVAGIRNGEVIQAPIMTGYRQSLFNLIDLLSKTDLIYGSGVEAAPAYKKVVKEYYSLSGVPSNSIVRNYTNEYEKE